MLLYRVLAPVLPYLLAFAAGAMMYVVVEELIPETAEGEHSNIGTIGFAVGFALMMMLDVALGRYNMDDCASPRSVYLSRT